MKQTGDCRIGFLEDMLASISLMQLPLESFEMMSSPATAATPKLSAEQTQGTVHTVQRHDLFGGIEVSMKIDANTFCLPLRI